jgi:hypothetical protein
MSRAAGPFAPPPPQQAGASRLLRAGPPASAASVLSAFGYPPRHAPSRDLGGLRPRPPSRRSPSHVPCQSRRPGSRRLHAGHRLASNRDARQADHEGTARPLAFDASSIFLTTPQQRTPPPESSRVGALSGTSSWSPPDAIKRALSLSLTTTVFNQRSTGRFGALPRRTTPEGQQASISSTAPPMNDVSYTTPPSAFVTHGCRRNGSRGRRRGGSQFLASASEAGSGCRGGDAVVVELEQVVGGGHEAPFRPARRSPAA